MKNYAQYILLISIVLSCFNTGYASNIDEQIGKCLSYKEERNRVIFQCERDIQVEIEYLTSGLLKIWYSNKDFKRNNGSFAVENSFDDAPNMNIIDNSKYYEIHAGLLILRINKDPFRVDIYDKYQKLLMTNYQNKGFVTDQTSMKSCKTLKTDEKIYGLGEKNGSLNRVGQSFKMWNSDKPCYSVSEDPLYKSIPFFLSSSGYGIFFDNTYKTTFDFGKESEAYYSFSTPGGEMEYYFIFGPSYKQIIEGYIQLTGKPIMPPAWALGFAQCRGLLTNEQLSRDVAKGYRSHQIPCDVIYQDIGWTQFLQDFEWRDENYENPQQMLTDLEEQGFKVIVSQDPVISQVNSSQWAEANELGYFTKDVRTGESYDMPWPWGGNCGIIDFSKPEVSDWWGELQQKPIDDGIRGFWTDMGEPAWSNEESSDRLFMEHHLGMHDEIHNVYGLMWNKIVTEQFEKRNPNMRVFQMTRASYAGMQKYTFGWSGDSGNGNDVTGGWEQMEAQLPMALSAGMCGVPFWTTDISGYCGDITDYDSMSELYVRWLQFGAFNPHSRIHHEGNNAVEPWLFGEEAERICKQTIEMKYQLFPYIYSYAREAYDTGLPLMRTMFLEFPNDPLTADLQSQFMFGEELLVAPVFEEDADMKRVYLPKGTWIDFHQPTKRFKGKQWIDYPVDLETIPMFVKSGSIIPRMPIVQYIGENPLYPLLIDIYPAKSNKKASFIVYEDDGETNNYKQDKYLTREISCATNRDDYQITYNENSSNSYDAHERDLVYKVYLRNKPSSILCGDKKVKLVSQNKFEKEQQDALQKIMWYWDSEIQACVLNIPSKERENSIVIK